VSRCNPQTTTPADRLYFFDAVTYAAFALIVLAAVPSPRDRGPAADIGLLGTQV